MGLFSWFKKEKQPQIGSGKTNYGVMTLNYPKLAQQFEYMDEDEIIGINFDRHRQAIVSINTDGEIQSLVVGSVNPTILSDLEQKNELVKAIREQIHQVISLKSMSQEKIEEQYGEFIETWGNSIQIFEDGRRLLQEARTEIERSSKIEENQDQIQKEDIIVEIEAILEGKYLIDTIEQEDGKMGVGMFWQNKNLEMEYMQIATSLPDKVSAAKFVMDTFFADYRKECKYNRDNMHEAFLTKIKYPLDRQKGASITSEFEETFSEPCQNPLKMVKRKNRVRMPEEKLEEVKDKMRRKYEKQKPTKQEQFANTIKAEPEKLLKINQGQIIEDEQIVKTILFDFSNRKEKIEGETEEEKRNRIVTEAETVMNLYNIVEKCDKEGTAATFEGMIKIAMKIDDGIKNGGGVQQRVQNKIQGINKGQALKEMGEEARKKYQEILDQEEHIDTPYTSYKNFSKEEEEMELRIDEFLEKYSLPKEITEKTSAKHRMNKKIEILLGSNMLTNEERQKIGQVGLQVEVVDRNKCKLLGGFLSIKGQEYLLKNSYLIHQYNKVAEKDLTLKPFQMELTENNKDRND